VYQVLGPVSHQWLDGSKLVSGCRKLNEWNPKSSSLLEITEDILATVGFIKFNAHMKSKF
jgi:hypothetical protein